MELSWTSKRKRAVRAKIESAEEAKILANSMLRSEEEINQMTGSMGPVAIARHIRRTFLYHKLRAYGDKEECLIHVRIPQRTLGQMAVKLNARYIDAVNVQNERQSNMSEPARQIFRDFDHEYAHQVDAGRRVALTVHNFLSREG
jgi:hypothetical protein